MNNNALIIRTMDDAERAAKAMAGSGFFADSRSAAQAVVKILAGAELGFGPFASMTGVHIIENKPTLSANLIAAAVKRSGKYNYRVLQMNNDICRLQFFEDGKEVGISEFTWTDAQHAGLANKANWQKYPKNMLFARAISNGQKWYAPDAFNGATVYTPDELGAVEDAEGNVIEGPAQDAPQGNPAPIPDSLWNAWQAMAKRAAAIGINTPEVDRDNTPAPDLIAAGKELRASVEAAEAQARAADPEPDLGGQA